MKTVRILIVEDEAVVAMQLKSALQKMGHTVVGLFASGEDALAGIAERTPELVLMDIRLQGDLDGIETAERLSRHHDLPIIFLSAHMEQETLDRTNGSLSYGYLLKPVEVRDLHVVIQMALCRHAQDISLKKAERSLRETNDSLKLILNSLNAVVYVADMQTHELLFVNEYGLLIWGRDIVGKPCWEALQAFDGPCSFCTNDKLVTADGISAGVYRWEFNNLVNRRWYDISDVAIPWTDGRLVRLEIATDISDRKQLEAEQAIKNAHYRRTF